MTVSRDPCGRWYVAFAVDAPDPEPLPAAGRAVGVDLGITDFAVTSDGQRIANPRHLARGPGTWPATKPAARPLPARSANRAKARAKVARAHRKIRAARADFLHNVSTGLVRDHDVIVLEDLAVQNMLRNRSLAQGDRGLRVGAFRAMLAYKAARSGAARDRGRLVVSRVEDLLGVRVSPRCQSLDTRRVAVPVLRHPA